ncbi:MAG: hypothetical protein KC476_10755, partial [Cyanobacteria bacterium HKST-UBA06]|nr:hypothetical protein [Cyanobacteria bacterium HKST-UBA06]
MPYKPKTGGRDRYCRPALRVMAQILLEGINPSDVTIEAMAQRYKLDSNELTQMIERLGETWEGFHPGDPRNYNKAVVQSLQTPADKRRYVDSVIGSVNNPVVRHRLTVFYNELVKLEQQFGKPDEIILEFVRGVEGLQGAKNALEYEQMIKANQKANDSFRENIENTPGLVQNKRTLEMLKLLKEQQGMCAYTGQRITPADFSMCEIDHIVPVSNLLSTDSMYNKVLCYKTANQEKGKQTPYRWLHHDQDRWREFVARVTAKHSLYSKKKQALLIREDAPELVESYNALAETAYVARLAQQIVNAQFGWGQQTKADQRHVFVCDGKETARIRRAFKLNELLLTGEQKKKLHDADSVEQQRAVWKKNRDNNRHHALDAYCISYSRSIKHYKDEAGRDRWTADGVTESLHQMKTMLAEVFPREIVQDKQRLLPDETIYGLKTRQNEAGKTEYCLTVHKNLLDYVGDNTNRKRIRNIFDDDIRQDLLEQSEARPLAKDWQAFLKTYRHPKRQSPVKRVVVVESVFDEAPTVVNQRFVLGEYKDFGVYNQPNKPVTRGQYKHTKQNRGQLFSRNGGDKWEVVQVYAHENLETVKQTLQKQGKHLYLGGTVFYSTCPISVDQPIKKGAFPAGKYTVRTIRADKQVKLETAEGEQFFVHAQELIEAGL